IAHAPKDRVGTNNNRIGSRLIELRENILQIARRTDVYHTEFQPKRGCCTSHILRLRRGGGILRIYEERNRTDFWNNITQQFQPFVTQFNGKESRASGISARLVQSFDQPHVDRIAAYRKYDWSGGSGALC